MLHVHSQANTPPAYGDARTYVPSVHPLPVEIIRVVSPLVISRNGSGPPGRAARRPNES